MNGLSGKWEQDRTAEVSSGIFFKHPSATANAALDRAFELSQTVGYTGYPADSP